jgi:putative protease
LFITQIDKALEQYNIKGFILSNIGTFHMLEKYKGQYEFIGNYTLNVFNSYSINGFKNLGLSQITLSPELNKNNILEINDKTNINKELIVYGNIPVMTLGYCVLGKSNKCYPNCKALCKSKNTYYLKDRLGLSFRVVPDNIQTLNTIYNSKITSLDFSDLPIDSVRIDILNENILEINNIIETVRQEKRFDGKDYTNADFIREV